MGPDLRFATWPTQVRHAADLCISPFAQVHRVSDVCSSPLRTSAAHPKAPRGGHIGSDVPLASPETLRGASARALSAAVASHPAADGYEVIEHRLPRS